MKLLVISRKLCFQVIEAFSMLSVEYFYSKERGRSGLNVIMTLSVPKSV